MVDVEREIKSRLRKTLVCKTPTEDSGFIYRKYNETNGLPGAVPERNCTGCPFYICKRLSGAGSGIASSGTKQESTHYLRPHAPAHGASFAQNQSNGASR